MQSDQHIQVLQIYINCIICHSNYEAFWWYLNILYLYMCQTRVWDEVLMELTERWDIPGDSNHIINLESFMQKVVCNYVFSILNVQTDCARPGFSRYDFS